MVDNKIMPNSGPESEASRNAILLSDVREKLKDPKIPRLTWNLPSQDSETENEISELNEYNSDSSSTTFCSDFEDDYVKEHGNLASLPIKYDKSEPQESVTNQNTSCNNFTILEVNSVMEVDTRAEERDTQQARTERNQDIICPTLKNTCHSPLIVNNCEDSFTCSPVFHKDKTDWNYLINSIIRDNDANNAFPTVLDATYNESIVNSTKNVTQDASSISNEDLAPPNTSSAKLKHVINGSKYLKTDSINTSVDLFADLSLGVENENPEFKNSLEPAEQNEHINHNLQQPADEDIAEIGITLSQILSIESTDSTSESSPDFSATQKLSPYKSYYKCRNIETKGLCNVSQGKKFKLWSQQTNNSKSRKESIQNRMKEKTSLAKQKKKLKFQNTNKTFNKFQKKIIEGKNKLKEMSSHERTNGPALQSGLTRENTFQDFECIGRRVTRMQTGSLPSVSSSSSVTSTSTKMSRARRQHSMIRDQMADIQQEVRAWLLGWGPPLEKARAQKLIAEVQRTQNFFLSTSQSKDYEYFKCQEVEELSQVSEKLVFQLQSALIEYDAEQQEVADMDLERESCCCSSESSDIGNGASNDDTCSQYCDFSDTAIKTKKVSSEHYKTIVESTCFQEKSFPENKTGEQSSNMRSCKSLGKPIVMTSPIQKNENTSGITLPQEVVGESLEITQSDKTKNSLNTATEEIMMPSSRDPRLKSVAYAKNLLKTRTFLTAAQSTYQYFSNELCPQSQTTVQIKETTNITNHSRLETQNDKILNTLSDSLINVNPNNEKEMHSLIEISNFQEDTDMTHNQIDKEVQLELSEPNILPKSQHNSATINSKDSDCDTNYSDALNPKEVPHLLITKAGVNTDISNHEQTMNSMTVHHNISRDIQSNSLQHIYSAWPSTSSYLSTVDDPIQIGNSIQQQKNKNSTEINQILGCSMMTTNTNNTVNGLTSGVNNLHNIGKSKITSDPRQGEVGLDVHLEQRKLNTPYTRKNTSLQTTSQNNIFQKETSELLTCKINLNASEISKKKINSESISGKKLVTDPQPSQLTVSCTTILESPLNKINATKQNYHNIELTKPKIQSLKNSVSTSNGDTTSPINNIYSKLSTESSNISLTQKTTKNTEATNKFVCKNNKHILQDASKSSIINRSESKQNKYLKPHKICNSRYTKVTCTTDSQCSDFIGLTQSQQTQEEEGSFMFGIKRIWLHSASEFIPNNHLPQGFWDNKGVPFPKDLIEGLENW